MISPLKVRKYIAVLGADCMPEEILSAEEIRMIDFTLSHGEELNSGERDEWGNWEYYLTKNDFMKPWLDFHVIKKLNDSGIKRKLPWPNDSPFAFCLSHDVDAISSGDFSQLSRRYAKLAAHESSAKRKLQFTAYRIYTLLKSLTHPVKDDPLWHFEKWHETEDRFDFTSTYYYFIGGGNLHPYDCDMIISDPMKFNGMQMEYGDYIKKLCELGYEAGLHGSYLTFDNAGLFGMQKKQLEDITGKVVTSSRQHFLHFDIKTTPDILQANGILIDSSLGFNRRCGFRAGTCFPYFIREQLLEVPQIIMDGALFNANSHALDETGAKAKIDEIITLVEAAGGCLSVNYHPNYLNRKAWWNSYIYLLSALKERNAWCASASDIYKLIEQRCADLQE